MKIKNIDGYDIYTPSKVGTSDIAQLLGLMLFIGLMLFAYSLVN